ncbi:hypothetical protein Q8A73_007398 [Channa argus]|nr:hypothetical protein Q8A73_007398 [Channa argus]
MRLGLISAVLMRINTHQSHKTRYSATHNHTWSAHEGSAAAAAEEGRSWKSHISSNINKVLLAGGRLPGVLLDHSAVNQWVLEAPTSPHMCSSVLLNNNNNNNNNTEPVGFITERETREGGGGGGGGGELFSEIVTDCHKWIIHQPANRAAGKAAVCELDLLQRHLDVGHGQPAVPYLSSTLFTWTRPSCDTSSMAHGSAWFWTHTAAAGRFTKTPSDPSFTRLNPLHSVGTQLQEQTWTVSPLDSCAGLIMHLGECHTNIRLHLNSSANNSWIMEVASHVASTSNKENTKMRVTDRKHPPQRRKEFVWSCCCSVVQQSNVSLEGRQC